jgi:hypothetical protein
VEGAEGGGTGPSVTGGSGQRSSREEGIGGTAAPSPDVSRADSNGGGGQMETPSGEDGGSAVVSDGASRMSGKARWKLRWKQGNGGGQSGVWLRRAMEERGAGGWREGLEVRLRGAQASGAHQWHQRRAVGDVERGVVSDSGGRQGASAAPGDRLLGPPNEQSHFLFI